MRARTSVPLLFTLASGLLVGCGGGGGSNGGGGPTDNGTLPLFASGNLQGRAAISSPPIVVSSPYITATALVGNFAALKSQNPVSTYQNSRIVFASVRRGFQQIFIMDADGSDITQLTNEVANCYDPTLSKDGTMIAYRLQGPSQSDIFMMNVDGSGRVALTNTSDQNERDPTFNGDGTKVAFTRQPTGGGPRDVYIVNVATKAVSQLTSRGDAEQPSWDVVEDEVWVFDNSAGWTRFRLNGSEDSSLLVFNTASQVQAGPQADMVTYIYSGKVQVLGPSFNTQEVFPGPVVYLGGLSPDGQKALLSISQDDAGGATQLSYVDFNTKAVTRITRDPYNYDTPEWGPQPISSTLIGTSNSLALSGSGFIYSQAGDQLTSALAFKATTQSSVVVASQSPQGNVGPNIIYSIDADNLTNISYANGTMLRPVRVVGSGAPIGNANGAIVSINSYSGKVVNVLAFAGSRDSKPVIKQEGQDTVITGNFMVVTDRTGADLAKGREVRRVTITSNGNVIAG